MGNFCETIMFAFTIFFIQLHFYGAVEHVFLMCLYKVIPWEDGIYLCTFRARNYGHIVAGQDDRPNKF